jgi:hypothetical protein
MALRAARPSSVVARHRAVVPHSWCGAAEPAEYPHAEGTRAAAGRDVRDVDLIHFPKDDVAFRGRVRAVMAEIPDASIERVEARLRDAYPNVRLVARVHLAELFPSERPTWYAFRDGRAVP